MNNFILILGYILIIVAIIWFVYFRKNYQRLVQKYTKNHILEISKKYTNDDDIVSDEDINIYFNKFTKKFSWLYKIPCIQGLLFIIGFSLVYIYVMLLK